MDLRKYFFERHDVECNQRYGDGLPYSFHLKAVEAQGDRFLHLISKKSIENKDNYRSRVVPLREIIRYALIAHDSIEDARMSYNDVVDVFDELDNYTASVMIADIIYCVTDEKGKSRKGRKNDKYYEELKANKLAIFVKLADLAANTLYSKLINSSMYGKYKSEFPAFKEKLYVEEYKEFFDYVESL